MTFIDLNKTTFRKYFSYAQIYSFLYSTHPNLVCHNTGTRNTNLDAKTKTPIPYVNVSFDDNNGTVSNDQGRFSITNINLQANDIIKLTCIGYKTKEVKISELQNKPLVYLNEDIKMLDAVLVKGKKIKLEDILKNLNDTFEGNHPSQYLEHKIFYREAANNEIQKINITLKKVTGISKSKLSKSEERIKEYEKTIKNDKTVYFTDFVAKVYNGKGNNLKTNIEKATSLRDLSKNNSSQDIQKELSKIMLQYLDSTHYYNIKSGIINIADSVTYSASQGQKFGNKESNYNFINNELEHTYKSLIISELSKLDFIYYPEDYNYKMDGVTTFDKQSVYILSFRPKKKSSIYEGKIYVSTGDYGVLKAVFNIAEGKMGNTINLKFILGIIVKTLKQQSTVIYKKHKDSKYYPAYISSNQKKYIFLDRPVKIIDITEPVNKISYNILIETNTILKNEILFLETKNITKDNYKNAKADIDIDVYETEKYEPEYWKDYKVLAPLKEMREFSTKK